ncbi:MAG: DUF2835 family protein [Rhodoferax sp.]
MVQFEFHLHIATTEYLQYYKGQVRSVVARCHDGRTVQFPAGLLTPFVSSSGVHGNFVLTCGADGKGADLRRR